MPPRALTALIVLGWLAASGWLFVRDLKPRLFPSGPPPFSIDLVDEARTQASTRWTVWQHDDRLQADVPKGYVETAIRYDGSDDTFELRSEFKLWRSGQVGRATADIALRSMYRVTREGALRELRSQAQMMIASTAIEFEIAGAIEGDVLAPRLKMVPAVLPLPEKLPAIKLAERGSVLNPMQPVNRLPGLRKGQRWRIPLIDPTVARYLNELTGGLAATQVSFLEAEVLKETVELDWNEHYVPCLQVHYEGDDTKVLLWVRESDGLLLKQEATLPFFGKLVMVRD